MFFITAFLFPFPLPLLCTRQRLRMGCEQVAAVMTVGQLTEVVAMLMMGWFLRAWRIKYILILALGGLLRYMLFAFGAENESLLSIMLGVALWNLLELFLRGRKGVSSKEN